MEPFQILKHGNKYVPPESGFLVGKCNDCSCEIRVHSSYTFIKYDYCRRQRYVACPECKDYDIYLKKEELKWETDI